MEQPRVSAPRSRMRTVALRLVAILLPCLPLAACTTYDYLPPVSDAGRECAAICTHAKQVCEAGKAEAEAVARSDCQAGSDYLLSECLADAEDDDEKGACRLQARDCSVPYPPVGLDCRPDFDRCYTDCGGRIVPRE
ncbi:hypothetical protein [Marilutibacter maris]|uniref:hypothetical protein n=1 Tax=Marilutibacter maris TaxID=1605891 RepID=UPI0011AE4919|nr:hypothetical protein [Lysobacter maris]